jgi:hypothetical protein
MKTWNLEINIMVTPNLSEEEIVAILQTELDHPEIESLQVSEIKEEEEEEEEAVLKEIFLYQKTLPGSCITLIQPCN